VRHEVAEALGDMGAIEAVPALQATLNDSSEMVAKTARMAITQLSSRSTDA
jgi:HEAT repeat protein